MQLCAFVFLEDISGELPPYEESYLSVPMDPQMMAAYRELEDSIRKALKEHRGNRSVLSTMLNTLLLYPDHPATRPSSKANWRRRSTLPAGFMTSTSSRSMRTSNPEQSGVCPTRSLPHLRNWVPFRNSRLRRSWGSSWKLGFHSRSNPRGGPAGHRSFLLASVTRRIDARSRLASQKPVRRCAALA